MKKLSLLGLFLLAGCASTGPEPFDQKLNNTPDGRGEEIGLRGDKAYIQKKVHLEERLWSLKAQVDDLQRAIYGASKQDPSGIFLGLRDCRKRVADPRLGGLGKADASEPWTNITQKEEAFFYQVDKKTNSLVGVSEEALDERIQRYEGYKATLETKYDEMKDKLDACEEKYHAALVQHGLNPDDTKAQGEWVDGPKGYKVWRMRKAATKDPEELMRRKAEKENE